MRILGTDVDVIRQVSRQDKVTQSMLVSVQNYVMQRLSDTWCQTNEDRVLSS